MCACRRIPDSFPTKQQLLDAAAYATLFLFAAGALWPKLAHLVETVAADVASCIEAWPRSEGSSAPVMPLHARTRPGPGITSSPGDARRHEDNGLGAPKMGLAFGYSAIWCWSSLRLTSAGLTGERDRRSSAGGATERSCTSCRSRHPHSR